MALVSSLLNPLSLLYSFFSSQFLTFRSTFSLRVSHRSCSQRRGWVTSYRRRVKREVKRKREKGKREWGDAEWNRMQTKLGELVHFVVTLFYVRSFTNALRDRSSYVSIPSPLHIRTLFHPLTYIYRFELRPGRVLALFLYFRHIFYPFLNLLSIFTLSIFILSSILLHSQTMYKWQCQFFRLFFTIHIHQFVYFIIKKYYNIVILYIVHCNLNSSKILVFVLLFSYCNFIHMYIYP